MIDVYFYYRGDKDKEFSVIELTFLQYTHFFKELMLFS